MKHLLLLTCLLVSQGLWAKNTNDSLLLKIDKRDQKIIGANKDSKKTLREELEGVFEKKGLVLTDSLWQQIRTVIRTDSEGDSSLSMQIGNSRVKIGVIKSGATISGPQKTFKMMYPNEGNEATIKKDSLSKAYITHKEGKDEVRIGLNGIHIKDGKDEVHVDWNGVHVKEPNGVETKVVWGQDSTKRSRKDAHLFNNTGFYLNLGLNGINGKPSDVQVTIYPPYLAPSDFDLKTVNSTFVTLGIDRSFNLIRGTKSAWRLGYGLGIDWYNFQFDHSRVIQKSSADQTIFQPILSKGTEVNLEKNKLAVSYLTLPLMSQLVFRKVSAIQMISFGGYASYRLASWTKTEEEKSGDKNKESSNFNLNQIRYGLRAEIAIRKFPDLFFNYDLSPMFESGTGLKMNGFSFGLRLL
jgi:hypothetical protein